MRPCRWRLEVLGAEVRCGSTYTESSAAGTVPALLCDVCRVVDHEPVPGVQAPVPGPCRHLGELTGERLATTCPHRPAAELYRCAVLTLCTLACRVLSVPCCLGCERREPA